MELKKYTVSVTRTSWASSTYEVEAFSEQEACQIAEEVAANEDWSGRNHSAEYESEAREKG